MSFPEEIVVDLRKIIIRRIQISCFVIIRAAMFAHLSKVSSILYSIKFYSTPEPNESQLNGRNYNVN